jgi:hypothetical protein
MAALTTPTKVEASTLYMSTNISSLGLYTLDPATAEGTFVGTDVSHRISDITSDWSPGSSRLWGVDGLADQLLQINPDNGQGTVVGHFATDLLSIAFDVTTGQLYGVGGNNLYRVDIHTAALTLVGPTNAVGFITFDLSGNLYGNNGPSLIKIDPSTGAATTVMNGFGFPPGTSYGLAVRPEDGVMFAVNHTVPSFLYRVNTTTGIATKVAPTTDGSGPLNNPVGLAFLDIPEPSSFMLLIVASTIGTAWRGCRRKRPLLFDC